MSLNAKPSGDNSHLKSRSACHLIYGRPIRFATTLAVRAGKLVATIVLCVQFLGTAAASPLLPYGRTPSETPHASVVRIIVPENGATSYGSGTLIDVRDEYGLVITNWHVVRDATGNIEVVFPDGFRSSARALKVDRHWDLAALVIWRPNAQPVPIATAAPQQGDRLMIAGYGQGNYRSATGYCTQYVAPAANLPFEMVEVNVEARQGDSGGPIFNERGELAGVLFGAGRGTTSGSYCGRVGGFLASLAPDLGKPTEIQIATNRPAAPQGGSPSITPHQGELEIPWTNSTPLGSRSELAVVNPPTRRASTQHDPPLDVEIPSASHGPETATAALAFDTPDSARAVTWQDVAGETPFEQAKTILAILGAAAVLFVVVRFTS